MSSKDADRFDAGVSLLFAPGERPGGTAMKAALESCQAAVQAGHEAGGEGALEVLVGGLSFDLDGLVPAPPARTPAASQQYGFDHVPDVAKLEAVALYPGAHIAGGMTLAPVVHAMTAVAAELAVTLPVRAVLWHGARTLAEPGRFSRATLAWLAGGTFPAAGLAGLTPLADGSVVSRGLVQFAGQEIKLEGRAGEAEAETLALAARIADRLVREGPQRVVAEFTIDDETLRAEPVALGKQVWLSRG